MDAKFAQGDRVRINATAGFGPRGGQGSVEYTDPTGRVWVLRDGDVRAVYFWPSELDLVKPRCETSDTRMVMYVNDAQISRVVAFLKRHGGVNFTEDPSYTGHLTCAGADGTAMEIFPWHQPGVHVTFVTK